MRGLESTPVSLKGSLDQGGCRISGWRAHHPWGVSISLHGMGFALTQARRVCFDGGDEEALRHVGGVLRHLRRGPAVELLTGDTVYQGMVQGVKYLHRLGFSQPTLAVAALNPHLGRPWYGV